MPIIKGRKVHWLDKVANELYEEVNLASLNMQQALSSDVPLGSVESTPQEQLSTFVDMTAQEHAVLRGEIGNEQYMEYVEAMKQTLRDQFGPLADFVMADFMEQVEGLGPPQEALGADQSTTEAII